MAAHRGESPRNLSRFKLTHAALAGGPHGRATGNLRRGMEEIISRWILSFFVFLLGDPLVHPCFFFPSLLRAASPSPVSVNDRAVKRRMTGATPVLTNRRDVGCQSVEIRGARRENTYVLFRESIHWNLQRICPSLRYHDHSSVNRGDIIGLVQLRQSFLNGSFCTLEDS